VPRPLRALVVAITLVAAGSGVSACSSTNSGDKGYIDGEGGITQTPVHDRKSPGTVEGSTLEDKAVALKQYAGKVVVLNVWGSWCPPCRKEAPALAAAARQLAPRGVVFLGIDTRDDTTSNGLAFQRTYGVPYPSLFDPAGRTLLAFHGIIPVSAIPSTVVIDKQGRVAATIVGGVPSQRTLVEVVQDVAS
jgi:thiol-disulfide isomerase/thioredoxin